MATGLLSLKWNNHKSTFFHVLSTIRSKESYCDVTLACDGRFYSLHKFVLSTCSEYFEEMFERTQCKHPVIVLKDIKHDDLEALLNYMYVGEVNVVQEKLSGLIKAAECLKIKGLAVPDEDPMESSPTSNINREQLKRTQRSEDSPRAKRRRRDNNSSEIEVITPSKRTTSRTSEDHDNRQSNNMPEKCAKEKSLGSLREIKEQLVSQDALENSSINANRKTESNNSHKKRSLPLSSQKKEQPIVEEISVEDADVKAEPLDAESEDLPEDDADDNKDSLHHELGFDDSLGNEENYVEVDPSMLTDHPQSVEDVVAQAMPGASGYQENSFPVWEGEGSLSNFPVEGFSGDNSQAHPMKARDLSSGGHSDLREPGDVVSDVAAASTIRAHIILNEEAIGNLFESDHSGKHVVYRCRICLYTTLKKNSIENHVVTHTDLNAFKCHLCPYKSNFKKDLVEHCNLHHQEASV